MFLMESHAKLAWNCTPWMSKMLLEYLLKFGSCCPHVLHMQVVWAWFDAMPRQLRPLMPGTP